MFQRLPLRKYTHVSIHPNKENIFVTIKGEIIRYILLAQEISLGDAELLAYYIHIQVCT